MTISRTIRRCRRRPLVFPGHSEYWTDDMYYALERYIEKGGKVYFSTSELDGHCDRTADGLFYWPRTSPCQFDWPERAPTLEGAFTAAPYRIIDEEAFDLKSARISKRATSLAWTAQTIRRWMRSDISTYAISSTCAASRNAAPSRFFTSKVGYGSGAFRMLAEGTNPTGGAHMVVRDLPSGGWVFTASSLAFNGLLSRDQMVAQIVRNLIANACRQRKLKL